MEGSGLRAQIIACRGMHHSMDSECHLTFLMTMGGWQRHTKHCVRIFPLPPSPQNGQQPDHQSTKECKNSSGRCARAGDRVRARGETGVRGVQVCIRSKALPASRISRACMWAMRPRPQCPVWCSLAVNGEWIWNPRLVCFHWAEDEAQT